MVEFQYQMAATTHVGKVREINEDSLQIVPAMNLAIVADGMGGHQAGEVASRLAVSSLCGYLEDQFNINADNVSDVIPESTMSEAFGFANNQVFTHARRTPDCKSMGTTLIAAWFLKDHAIVGHIGDSRLYKFSHGVLEQLSDDHTLANEFLSASGQDQPAYSRHILRKALGLEYRCKPDIMTLKLDPDDTYLLCSDGLTGVLEDEEIGTVMTLRAHQPERCLKSMIDHCLEKGAPDNISIVQIKVVSR